MAKTSIPKYKGVSLPKVTPVKLSIPKPIRLVKLAKPTSRFRMPKL